jgi:hypothetical protein
MYGLFPIHLLNQFYTLTLWLSSVLIPKLGY